MFSASAWGSRGDLVELDRLGMICSFSWAWGENWASRGAMYVVDDQTATLTKRAKTNI